MAVVGDSVWVGDSLGNITPIYRVTRKYSRNRRPLHVEGGSIGSFLVHTVRDAEVVWVGSEG